MKKRVLFIYPGMWSFVECDKKILEQQYDLKLFYYEPGKSLFKNMYMQIRLIGFLLQNIRKADALFIWFADYHSFLPVVAGRLFHKKTILLLGGYDVVYIPKIKYGAFSNPVRSYCAGYSISNAAYVLPVDPSLGKMAIERVGTLKGLVQYIPFGYQANEWYCDSIKEDIVLTVANIKDYPTFIRKGLDFFIAVAKTLPLIQFVIIGKNSDLEELKHLPANVQLIPKLPIRELRAFYSKSKMYAQFSIHEGMPNVLCEAMLCECIPIGTNVCGIPTTIDGKGYIVESVEEATKAITEGMRNPVLGKEARHKIMNDFSLTRRETSLFQIIG